MLTGLSVSFLIGSAIQQAMDKGINKISFYGSVAKPSNMLSVDTFWSMGTTVGHFLRSTFNLQSISDWNSLELTDWLESGFIYSKIRRRLWRFFQLILCSLNRPQTKYPCNYPHGISPLQLYYRFSLHHIHMSYTVVHLLFRCVLIYTITLLSF